jgi:hypothetical protein
MSFTSIECYQIFLQVFFESHFIYDQTQNSSALFSLFYG